jgi:hypothetical protein
MLPAQLAFDHWSVRSAAEETAHGVADTHYSFILKKKRNMNKPQNSDYMAFRRNAEPTFLRTLQWLRLLVHYTVQ